MSEEEADVARSEAIDIPVNVTVEIDKEPDLERPFLLAGQVTRLGPGDQLVLILPAAVDPISLNAAKMGLEGEFPGVHITILAGVASALVIPRDGQVP